MALSGAQALVSQPSPAAIVLFAAIAVVLVAGVAGLFWLIDARRSQWRDPIVIGGVVACISVLTFSTVAFLSASPESASFAPVPAAGVGLLFILLVTWWFGYGRPLLFAGALGSVLLTIYLANPMAWVFIGSGMVWIVALLLPLLAATVLGRHGRYIATEGRARRQRHDRVLLERQRQAHWASLAPDGADHPDPPA
jgi:hypothetical protein